MPMTRSDTPSKKISASAAANQDWDCLIIGAGMGGSAAAWSLSRQGYRVLVIEKGRSAFQAASSVAREMSDPATRLENGRWPTQISGRLDGADMNIWAPLGSGAGGSTTLYAAALHRLRPEDFAPQKTPDGKEISWPFSYEDIAPYYTQAEQLFGVHGTQDPLRPDPGAHLPEPPEMCARDAYFLKSFTEGGLHPYRLHSGIGYEPGCKECLGSYCPSGCKRDARNTLLDPALESGQVKLCAEAEVLRIEANANAAHTVIIQHEETECQISAPLIILAAGAYFSPALLLRSTNESWPDGLANQNDLVGRNLMFHASDPIAVWPRGQHSKKGPTKTLSIRDFYSYDGKKYGELQSAGQTANFGNVLYSLRLSFDQSPLRKLPLIRQLLRIPAWLASRVLGEATVFTTIVEDYAYHDNRVVLDPDGASGIRFHYTIRPELLERAHKLKTLLRARFKPLYSLPLSHRATLNYGHPCGTCKAGDDPETSVLDANCKAHMLDNLYVVDSSFMPTSGGTNPSLTIAANALRVADIVAKAHAPKT